MHSHLAFSRKAVMEGSLQVEFLLFSGTRNWHRYFFFGQQMWLPAACNLELVCSVNFVADYRMSARYHSCA